MSGSREPLDDRPHSRACGIVWHTHGTRCARDCPTCNGVNPVGFPPARALVTSGLTALEHDAVRLAGELWGVLCRAVDTGPTRDADLAELIHHVHAIQHTVMAQAAARAHPDLYRLLGSSLQPDHDNREAPGQ